MKVNLGAIILAAGKGTRMQANGINKVAMPLADKPMILHTIELLEILGIKNIVVVVGYAKTSVMNVLGQKVIFAEQSKRLGTAHALRCGFKKIPEDVENILVLNGDDSAFYTEEIINQLISKHFDSGASFTFLTIETDNPKSLGRVVRNKENKLVAIVEEKDATQAQRSIKEINPACYLFKTSFLNKYLSKVEKSPVTGEYYLTSLIDIGIKSGEFIETLNAGKIVWRGINTKEELEEAEKLLNELKPS